VAELERLGVPLVPAVAVGDRAVHGWNPGGYANLLGVDYRESAKLPPDELARRLDGILHAAERLVAGLPASALDFTPPERDRTVRDLGFHLFRLALAYADAVDRGALPEGPLQEKAPAAMRDGPALARYGADVRARLRRWFAEQPSAAYARTVRVYYGPQSGHDLLERTTWHAAQHLRQLYALAERLEIEVAAPLPAELFAGLPLPDALW
jgi:hypothetical protein